MKDPKASNSRKPWYQRLVEMASIWRTAISKSTAINPAINVTLWKSISKSTGIPARNHRQQNNMRKFTSLKVVTRVCLCAPISSFNEIFQAELPPRTSHSNPRPKPLLSSTAQDRISSPRLSIERRRIFRGKSLTDDVLMRKFVIEEEAMMQVRRRNQVEVIKRRSLMRREKLGPSPLSKMIMAQEENN